MVYRRTQQAEKLLAQLDAELADSGERSGRKLSWTAAEADHLTMIAATVDRRVHLQGRYENTDPLDTKNLVRLSTEIRQCDSLVSRLLARINTEVPDVRHDSPTTRRARHAALKRWHPGAVG